MSKTFKDRKAQQYAERGRIERREMLAARNRVTSRELRDEIRSVHLMLQGAQNG